MFSRSSTDYLMSEELIEGEGGCVHRAFVSIDYCHNGRHAVEGESLVRKHVSDENSSGLTWDAGFTDYSTLRIFCHSNSYRF